MSYDSTISALSPVGRWKLDETSGTTATATAGSNGTYAGSPTLGATALLNDGGKSMTTDGTDDEVQCPVSVAGATAGSVVFWWAFVSNQNILFRDNTNAAGSGWFVQMTGGQFAVRINGGSNHTVAVSTTPYVDGAKHMFALTTDGSTVKFYADGTLLDTWTKAANFSTVQTPLHFGRNGTGTGTSNFDDGKYDDTAYWTSELSGADVSALWTAGTLTGSTGNATLSLSASGTARGPATGTASLSLVGSGTAASSSSGTAALSLSGSGSAKAPLIASAALSLSASGSGASPGVGTASITLVATGDATTGAIPATGDAALSLAASGSGQATVTGLAAITLAGSGSGAGQVVGVAAFELSASAVAAGALDGGAQIDLVAAGLVSAGLAGTAFLVLTAEAPTLHAPYRDVDVLAIVDVSRLVAAADASRDFTIADVSRLVVAALTDGSKKMKLDPSAREFYALTIDTDPQISAWEASFDGRATWFDGELVDGTDNKFRWLVRGPDFDPTGQIVATSIPLPLATTKPVIRASDDPEVIYRGNSDAKVPTILVKASG